MTSGSSSGAKVAFIIVNLFAYLIITFVLILQLAFSFEHLKWINIGQYFFTIIALCIAVLTLVFIGRVDNLIHPDLISSEAMLRFKKHLSTVFKIFIFLIILRFKYLQESHQY